MKIGHIIPGIIFTFLLAMLAVVLSSWLGTTVLQYVVSPVSAVLLAIVIGIILRTFCSLPAYLDSGIDFTSKYILRFGIILLGIRLSLFEFVQFGLLAIPLILVCFFGVFVAIRLCLYFFPISKNMSYLIGIGTAICGVTAIVATSPLIKAKQEEVAYAIAIITLFGMFAMLAYPFTAHALFPESNLAIGLFLGTSLHDTTQVTGAALIYSEQFNNSEVVNITVVTKLIRNSFLVILIPMIAMMYKNNNNQSSTISYSFNHIFPYFVLGFLGMVMLRTIGDASITDSSVMKLSQWQWLIANVKIISEISLTMAMVAMGLLTYVSKLKILGGKPMVVGLVAAMTVGFASLLYIYCLIR